MPNREPQFAKPLRLVLADDHPLVLAGMRDYLSRDIHLQIIDAVDSPTALVECIRQHEPDVVVTDFSMPGDTRYSDGLPFISYLTRHFPHSQILVVTMMSNPVIIAALYKAGVRGVVLKSDDLSKLWAALNQIRSGRAYMPQRPASGTPSTTAAASTEGRPLSPKEIEVLRRFVDGQSLSDIAQTLNRSIKTISNQKRSAMRKLSISSDQELIASCVSQNLFG